MQINFHIVLMFVYNLKVIGVFSSYTKKDIKKKNTQIYLPFPDSPNLKFYSQKLEVLNPVHIVKFL